MSVSFFSSRNVHVRRGRGQRGHGAAWGGGGNAGGSETGGTAAEGSGGVGQRGRQKPGRGAERGGSRPASTASRLFKKLMKNGIVCEPGHGTCTLDATAFIVWRARCFVDPSSMFAEWVEELGEQQWF